MYLHRDNSLPLNVFNHLNYWTYKINIIYLEHTDFKPTIAWNVMLSTNKKCDKNKRWFN